MAKGLDWRFIGMLIYDIDSKTECANHRTIGITDSTRS